MQNKLSLLSFLSFVITVLVPLLISYRPPSCAVVEAATPSPPAIDHNEDSSLLFYTTSVPGYVSTTPLLYKDLLIIGSEDFHVYALRLIPNSNSPPSIVWSFNTGGRIESVPTASEKHNMIYVTSVDTGNCYGLNADNGGLVWTYATGYFVYSSPSYDPIADTVLFGGTSSFRVYAVTASAGHLVWNYRSPTSGRFKAKPLIVYNGVDVSTPSGVDGELLSESYGAVIPTSGTGVVAIGDSNGGLFLLSALNGALIWKASIACDIVEGAGYCPPQTSSLASTEGGFIFAGCSNKVRVFSFNSGSELFVNTFDRGGKVVPFTVPRETVMTGGELKFDIAVATTSGQMASLAFSDAPGSGSGSGVTTTTGAAELEENWRVSVDGVVEGHIAVLNGEGQESLLFVNSLGELFSVTKDTGTVEFVFETRRSTFSGPVIRSSLFTSAGRSWPAVFWPSRTQTIYALNLSAAVVDGWRKGETEEKVTHARSDVVVLAIVLPCTLLLAGIIVGIVFRFCYTAEEEEEEVPQQHGPQQMRTIPPLGGGGILRVPEQPQPVPQPPYQPLAVPATTVTVPAIPLQGTPTHPDADDDAGKKDNGEELQLWENNQTLSRAITELPVSNGPSVELPWDYVVRLTKNFSHPLHSPVMQQQRLHHNEHSAELYLASEFVDGALMRLIIKVFKSSSEANEPTSVAPHELQLISRLRHRNIIPIYAWATTAKSQEQQQKQKQKKGSSTKAAFASRGKGVQYATVMKYVPGGSVADILRSNEKAAAVSGNSRLYIALGVGYGLRDMHSKGIFHRDLKSNNVLVDNQGDGVLIDFDVACEAPGLNAISGSPQPMQLTTRRRVFGTPGYICPDYARLACGYGEPQEVFSFCVFLAELLTGTLSNPVDNDLADPANPLAEDPRLTAASRDPHHHPEGFGASVSQTLRETIRRGTVSNHRHRPTLKEVLRVLRRCLAARNDGTDLEKELQREYSAVSSGELGADSLEALRPGDRLPEFETVCAVGIECSICGAEYEEEGPTGGAAAAGRKGVECSAPERHFVCDDCLNNRVASLLDAADAGGEGGLVDLMSLRCTTPSCSGFIFLASFAPFLHPINFRRWHLATTKAAQRQGRETTVNRYRSIVSQGQLGEFQKHFEQVRQLLRPVCPFCGLVFLSFSGCLCVTCGVRSGPNSTQRIHGCGRRFCGACLVPFPCPARHGHGSMTNEELQECWKTWRIQHVRRYMAGNVGNDSLRRVLLEGLQAEFDNCGISMADL